MPAPMVLADTLERRFGVLPPTAKAMALEMLTPAIAAGDPVAIAEAMRQIEKRLLDVLTDAEIASTALGVAKRVSTGHAKHFYPALSKAVGMPIVGGDTVSPAMPAFRRRGPILVRKPLVSPGLLTEEFATKNAKLIKTLRSELVPALRDEVVRAQQFGMSAEQAADRLAKKWAKKGVPIANGNAEPRLRMIVRDQIAKLNTDLTKARQEASGIKRFRWISQRDDRVRPLHEEIDGEIYDWSAGHPTEGLPGQPPNCRCVPEAVVVPDEVMAGSGFIVIFSEQEAADLVA